MEQRTRRRPSTRHAVMGLVLVAAVSSAACASDGDSADTAARTAPTTTTSAEPAAPDTVTMRLIAFKPDTVTVERGTTVTWMQEDAGAHTVTSGTVEQSGGGVTERPDGRFDSGDIATGETFTFTFAEPGTYPYFCTIHPATMTGEVRVG